MMIQWPSDPVLKNTHKIIKREEQSVYHSSFLYSIINSNSKKSKKDLLYHYSFTDTIFKKNK